MSETMESPVIHTVMADPASIFDDVPRWKAFYDAMEASAKGAGHDVATQSGRDRIASHAYAVARVKTAIDNAGKTLTDDWRKRTNAVNAKRRLVWDKLEALQHATRQPLDEWDSENKRREDGAEAILVRLHSAALVGINDTADQIQTRLNWVRGINDLSAERFGEKTEAAVAAHSTAILALVDAHKRLLAAEAQQAELVALREQQMRAARERDMADRQRAVEQMAEANKLAVAQAAEEATRRALERAAAENAANVARIERERAEETAAQVRRAAAVEAEDRRRREDTVHRGVVNSAALEALIEHVGLEKRQAKAVVTAIAKGLIPAVSINY